MENETYYIKNVSFSQVGCMMRDPGQRQASYLLWQWDNKMGIAATVWCVAHKFVEYLLRTNWDQSKALNMAYKSIYNGKDKNTYYIDITGLEGEYKKDLKDITFEEIKQHFRTKIIDFWTKGMDDLLKKIKGAIDWYLSEKISYGDILGLETSMEFEICETILDRKFILPVPMKAIADQVCRLTEDRHMIDHNKEQVTFPAWSIYLEDTKFKDKFSEMNQDDPKYFFQAFFLYYTSMRQYNEAPKFINFREIKTSKNRDGSSQHQVVTIIFSWDDFELAKTDFWRYMMEFFNRVKFLQDSDIMFNCFTMLPKQANEAWAKQRAFYRNIPVDQLKTKISISNRSSEAGNNFSWHDFNLLDKGKKIEKGDMTSIITIEDEIRAKMLEYGIPIQYEKTNEWYAYNQILFTPGRWIEMNKIEKKLKELQQATGYEQIRIEAPIPGTKFVGIEYPRADRKFLDYSEYKQKKRGLKIPMWKNLHGDTIEIDLTDSNYPHLLVAGTTGSGKSEFLKVAIESLMGKCELCLIDPKMVEFSEFEWRVAKYLVWEQEIYDFLLKLSYNMKSRYEILKEKSVKDIEGYNKKARNKKDKMERIVVIIDEFADLKHSEYGNEIEHLVEKITALWRAAWIHMIIATQRPDVKIINGRIKNNIGTRICLKVWSSIDSKVIIETTGAEQLLGKWDLIFKDWVIMQRLQSFYIPKKD